MKDEAQAEIHAADYLRALQETLDSLEVAAR